MKVLFHWRGSRLELGHTPETCHDVELQQSNKPPHVLFVTVSFLTPHCSCCCVTCWRPLHHRGLWLRCQRFKWQIFMCSVRMFSSPGCLVEPVCVLWDGVTESWTSVAPSKDKNTAHMPNWGQVAGPLQIKDKRRGAPVWHQYQLIWRCLTDMWRRWLMLLCCVSFISPWLHFIVLLLSLCVILLLHCNFPAWGQ